MWFELHNHTHFSMFDGFGKINDKVKYAKKLGMPAVGISDHGNVCGIAQLYMRCKQEGITPILGCEVYFQPTYKPGEQRFHLCLFVKNAVGYENLCRILYEANVENFYRYAHVTFDILQRFHEGLICTSACISGFVPYQTAYGKKELAIKAAKKFKNIFGDDFYFELMPIDIDDLDTQKRANTRLMHLGRELGIKSIITTDAHFIEKDDFDSYLMMHELSRLGSKQGERFSMEEIEKTYKERYMHSEEEIVDKFIKMHGVYPAQQLDAMEELLKKIDLKLDFSHTIPTFDRSRDCYQDIKKICLNRLKETGRYNKEYIDKLKYEMEVIKAHDLCDYFLIVRDYVQFARDNNIYVGPGRGSVCGSLIAELMEITDVDPLVLGTDFNRFLRKDKKKMPDIDLDFEAGDGQRKVIDYVLHEYEGKAAQIVTFGYYMGANLVNDLAKIYAMDADDLKKVKQVLLSKVMTAQHHRDIKELDINELLKDKEVRIINKEFPDLVKHFCKLVGQVKYYGQHPAGVVITQQEISQVVPMMNIRGKLMAAFDKTDVDDLGILKFDILALKTLNILHKIEDLSGDKYDPANVDAATKKEMYERFRTGNSLGIFQCNSPTARQVLEELDASDIQDVIAALSLNRPGTLKASMHKVYAQNKQQVDKSTLWYPYTMDTYGTVIYQEHVMKIAGGMAKMDPVDVDKLVKCKFTDEERQILKKKFIEGSNKHSGLRKEQAEELFEFMGLYTFNKAHSAGYALISEWQMYHKVKNKIPFWFATLKYEAIGKDERKRHMFMGEAIRDGIIFFLPHVNYTADYSVRKVDGEYVIQEGLSVIKGVGEKAALYIEEERKRNGIFKSKSEFVERCKSRQVHTGVLKALDEEGAIEFDKQRYLSRVVKYNAAMFNR
jgi:DNA polymerase-3 subunit alpha